MKNNQSNKQNHDYKSIALTIAIPLVGFASGYLAHVKFNPLFEESNASDNWVLPARYSVGYTAILPVYVMTAILQSCHYQTYTPIWRRVTDFIVSGFVVGCGVMFGRLFGKSN